jgi:hypothetical protein
MSSSFAVCILRSSLTMTLWLYVERTRWHKGKGEEVDLLVRTHMRLRL